MQHPFKTSVIGFLLLIESLTCSALTLGRARGAVVLGQPLDLSMPLMIDEGEDIAASCLDAEVFYGDALQPRGRVTWTPASTANGQSAAARVQSSQPVDEPVVTVNLRAGCAQRVTRRYVLLADVPSDTLPSLRLAVPAAAGTTPASAPVPPRTEAARPSVVAVKPEPVKPVPVRQPRAERAKAGNPKAKLKLDAVDLREQRDPELKFTQELFTQPVENSKSAAVAIALWRALNAQPEEILRDGQRLQELDADVKALRAVTVKNEANLVDMTQRLQKAESERFANGLVYGLLALLIGCLVGLLLLWRRRKNENGLSASWWQGSEVAETQQGDMVQPTVNGRPSAAGDLPVRTTFSDIDLDLGTKFVDIDLNFTNMPDVADKKDLPVATAIRPGHSNAFPPSSLAPPTAWSVDRGFSPSMVNALRSTNTEEMVDVRQQADFFISLGQHDRAIHALQDRIDGHLDASPLVYLDLLQLFRRLGRSDDFSHCRDSFNRLFTGKIPEYASFDDKGNSLEAYAGVMAHIAAHWSSDQILEILEGCIFRRADEDLGQPFDLQAFEDLLLLHAVATRLVAGSPRG